MLGLTGRRKQPVTNVDVHPTVEYAMDPRGHALFAGLTRANHDALTHQRPIITGDANWSGWTKEQQRLRGMNPGGTRPVVSGNTTLDQAHSSTLTDPTTAILARRLARGQR